MKLSKREKIMVIILLLVASIAGFVSYVYLPGQSRQKSLTEEIETDRKILSGQKSKNDEAAKIIKQADNINNEIRDLEAKMAGAADIPGIVVRIYELLTKNNLTGDRLEFSDKIEEEKYDYYTVSFNAKGKLNGIKMFLSQLEGIGTEFSISSFDLDSEGPAAEGPAAERPASEKTASEGAASEGLASEGQEVFLINMEIKLYMLKRVAD